ncbi:MAG: hypothetical protein E7668_06670 [Ruminococcaceae bacterium]|nr:hypothetical protein [Oscillospiraceae bacterium]
MIGEYEKMKILILYATRGGATQVCAELLAQRLEKHHTVTLCNAAHALPAPQEFDAVAIGSSIRMGQMNKQLKRYIKEHKERLSEGNTAVFFCCGFPKQFEEYTETQLPKDLYCSLGLHCFGGELKPEKLKGFDKLIVRIVRSSILSQDFEKPREDQHDLPELLPENIALLAEKIENLKE